MACRTWSVLTLLLVACSSATLSKTFYEDQTTIDFQPSPVTQNLTQQIVTQTFQDSIGNIWFVTQEGLNRYNGHQLENYRYSLTNPQSLSHDAVTSIVEDQAGNVWVSTRGGGLNRYNRVSNSFSALLNDESEGQSPLSNDILTLFSDREGEIWIGYDNAFSKFEPTTGTFSHYFPQQKDLPYLGEINSFTQSADGTIWAATIGSGLLKIDKESMTMDIVSGAVNETSSSSLEPIFHVYADTSDHIWLLSLGSGVTKYDPSKGTSVHYHSEEVNPNSLSSNTAFDIFEDRDRRIWICTLEGLDLYVSDTESFQRFNSQNTNLPSSRLHSIYQSQEGVYWVGTVVGLATGSKNLFPKYNSSIGKLSNDSVNAFGETVDGSIWIGTDNGLNRFRDNENDSTWINEYSEPSISNSTVMSLLGEDSILWIGTFSGGLNKLDIDTNKVTTFRSSRFDDSSLAANGVTSILRASSGKLLVGTYGGGLSVLDETTGKFTNFTHDPLDSKSLSNNNVIALFEDSLGFVWIGTENGLNRYDSEDSKFHRIFTERGNTDSISSDMVWSFYEDQNQDLWLGTKGGGLNKWEHTDRALGVEKFRHYSEDIALPSSNIYGIQSDPDGNIWLSHNRGVTKLNPKTGDSRQYGIKEGLQDTEFNMGASFKASNGLIYFGGNLGFNIVDPLGFVDKEKPPKISISEIKIMNERQEFAQPYNEITDITLTHNDRMFSVEFFAADYSNPPLVQYAYKMEGINDNWIVSDDARQASFTTLPAGEYTLRLAAASPGGVWNWDSKSVRIKVLPPPWKSSTAYIAYSILALAAVLTLLYQQHRREMAGLARQRELELKVKERTIDLEEARSAAEQANRAKSDFLATMSHEIRTPMHGMIGMTELLLHTELSNQQKKFASAAHKSGVALLALINDILDFSKIEASRVDIESAPFDVSALIEDTCYLQSEPAARKGLDLNHTIDRSVPTQVLGDPGKIRQILMNLLNNAIKFTDRGEISVVVEFENSNINNQGNLKIVVRDTGIGMDDETTRRVFDPFIQADASTTRKYGGTGLGLSITRNYIELMGGFIHVSSKPEQGTEILISIPTSACAALSEHTIPANLRNTKVLVLSTKHSTRRMIKTQLERMGVLNIQTSKTVPLSTAAEGVQIPIVDLDGLANQSGLCKKYRRGILLMPLHETEVPPQYKSWLTTTKPCTSETLRLAMEEILTESDIEKSTEVPFLDPDSSLPLRILVVEDIPTNQRIAQEVLEMSGHKVHIAQNGAEAVELQRENRYDLIFMDCQMPVMDGYQATRIIREEERNKEIPPVKIIALTAGITATDKKSLSDAGMDGYLGKPFKISDITKIIHHHLGSGHQVGKSKFNERSADAQSAKASSKNQDVIDLSAIENITYIEQQTGKSILPEVYSGFKVQMAEKMMDLSIASTTGNLEQAQSIAHAIKSMCANLGAKQVKIIASDIELGIKQGKEIDLQTHCIHLESAYKLFAREVESRYEVHPMSKVVS
ncbi:MAG: two-component regulator propeller domain-containing protein [Haliea sp.]|uniref:two-component regulator propeller domain-containing protein n=1 Tax=Haliea sp. TaxID=1932666 RepID=UPI0032EDE33A